MHWRRKWQPTPVSCLENSRDGGAWWAAVYGVAQSRTRLKRLSSSSAAHVLFPSCGVWASQCGGFYHFGAQALGTQALVAAARRVSSCGAQA